MVKRETNLFDVDEVIKFGKIWIKENEFKETGNDEMNAYCNGRADGVRFMIMLLKRTGD